LFSASVAIIAAPTAVSERENATGGSTLTVNSLSCRGAGEPFYI